MGCLSPTFASTYPFSDVTVARPNVEPELSCPSPAQRSSVEMHTAQPATGSPAVITTGQWVGGGGGGLVPPMQYITRGKEERLEVCSG